MSDRRRQGTWSARGTPELLLGLKRRNGAAVRLRRLVKLWGSHLSNVAPGCAFVLGKLTGTLDVAEKLGRLFTPWIRCARAFGRGTGGAININPRITRSARKIQFHFFILNRHRSRHFCAIKLAA
jgi:hypothetical protein